MPKRFPSVIPSLCAPSPGWRTSLAAVAVLFANAAGALAQSPSGFLSAGPAFQLPLLIKGAAAALPAPLVSPLETSDSLAADPAPLPEAPAPQLALKPEPKRGSDPAAHIARKDTMTIPSDWHAQRLTARDKVKAGAEDLYSFDNFAALFISAGYEQLLNGAPNYGTDKGAFGERLGAAAIRETSQSVFTEMVFAPLLHEDDRYYVKGPHFGVVNRTLYAITRPLVTRRDDGRSTVNGALLLGYAASAALTPAYYPQINRNFHDAASVYGGSIGGAALGFFVSEFSQDALRALHLSKAP